MHGSSTGPPAVTYAATSRGLRTPTLLTWRLLPPCTCGWHRQWAGQCRCPPGLVPRRRSPASPTRTGLRWPSEKGGLPRSQPFPNLGSPAPRKPPIERWLTDTADRYGGARPTPPRLRCLPRHRLWLPHPTSVRRGLRTPPLSPTPWSPTLLGAPDRLPPGRPSAGEVPLLRHLSGIGIFTTSGDTGNATACAYPPRLSRTCTSGSPQP